MALRLKVSASTNKLILVIVGVLGSTVIMFIIALLVFSSISETNSEKGTIRAWAKALVGTDFKALKKLSHGNALYFAKKISRQFKLGSERERTTRLNLFNKLYASISSMSVNSEGDLSVVKVVFDPDKIIKFLKSSIEEVMRESRERAIAKMKTSAKYKKAFRKAIIDADKLMPIFIRLIKDHLYIYVFLVRKDGNWLVSDIAISKFLSNKLGIRGIKTFPP